MHFLSSLTFLRMISVCDTVDSSSTRPTQPRHDPKSYDASALCIPNNNYQSSSVLSRSSPNPSEESRTIFADTPSGSNHANNDPPTRTLSLAHKLCCITIIHWSVAFIPQLPSRTTPTPKPFMTVAVCHDQPCLSTHGKMTGISIRPTSMSYPVRSVKMLVR
ncbi:hypothetical protein C8F04DRAFT_450157 [Mycena alexandri]|uniref:Secreted protein n=1 Tax=Mycena alexandri TaxID=1745969 RepID=A0AAD6XDC3_9AGAR|nr:hypothetical protein C8F04DRAFT_450157 [Mycena alexandri]